jgi:hypothetical protein
MAMGKVEANAIESRIGDADPSIQVRQALANVTLEGLHPDPLAISLAEAMANGSMRIDEAVASLCIKYAHHT